MADKSTTNNNNKQPPTISSSSTTESAEDLIKSNKSTMQQLLQALDENTQLKEDLIDREAKLLMMQESINQVLTAVNSDCNALYKEVNKSLVVLSDVVKALIEPNLQKQFTRLNDPNTPREAKVYASNQFRSNAGLPPLNLQPSQPPK